ncbi:hypothetical protein AVEN_14181-1 [Araneus ventricosus]|uniref:Uncharacterized protein n=1 Tax=Araneus ventricosus TaxID=182803 RepID=A0A4Y2KDY4_ARAVE|nr:hypothetical protein AVEN_14181-1 [Araneus ventricosus]
MEDLILKTTVGQYSFTSHSCRKSIFPKMTLNSHARIDGSSGNEAADVLAKKATQEGIPTYIPAPRNLIKGLLQKESIIRWQKEWDNGDTGRCVHNVLPKVKTIPTPWQRPEIICVTGHGPFATYLKRFNIKSNDSCGCGNMGNPLNYATSCLFTTSYPLTKPSADLEPLWWKRVMSNNNSKSKIRKLIYFIAENETLLFPKDGDNYPRTQLTLCTHILSSSIHRARPSQIQQHNDLKD